MEDTLPLKEIGREDDVREHATKDDRREDGECPEWFEPPPDEQCHVEQAECEKGGHRKDRTAAMTAT